LQLYHNAFKLSNHPDDIIAKLIKMYVLYAHIVYSAEGATTNQLIEKIKLQCATQRKINKGYIARLIKKQN